MSDLLFDTCFLIDFERELKRQSGAAHDFLADNHNAVPWISWVVAGEFAEGFGDIDDPACAALLARFEVVEATKNTASHYARITSRLRSKRQLIGANDLWIAAAALAQDFPLVSRNTSHFTRVPGLKVITY